MFLGRYRPHLFEFGDQTWCPRVLRDAETAYLAVAYRTLPLPHIWASKISTALEAAGSAEILDLCSGSGGVMPQIIDQLQAQGCPARATLSDLYPNPRSVSHRLISWRTEPLDASRVPRELSGVRTMFSAFHHFRPQDARAILKDAFDQRRAICIFESGQGTMFGIAAILPVPLVVLLLMPFARPMRWGFLVFTYLIPIMPLMLLWDGVVSMLRIYSPERMQEMIRDLQSPDYTWEIGRIHAAAVPGGLPYIIGRPGASSGA